ncbi:hypothetical protein Tco_1068225 [Tanacetum coccineum]|uniref:Uncharacterized protein n=1 Tax=Tanacetum coccineum TaxID=301880 RepID=A0ABQ5HF42_9ASTR
MSNPKFAETYNMVAFLEKTIESDGFGKIIDFLKASSIHYALTATVKVQTVNEVRQLQALVDKKRVIVTESSIRRDLHLDVAEGTDCLPTATIFEELSRMGNILEIMEVRSWKIVSGIRWNQQIQLVIPFITLHQLVSEPKFLIKMFPRRSEGEELEYPFFEGDDSSSDEWKDYGMAGDDYEGHPIFDDDHRKKNRCQFMIPISKMSLRKKKDLLRKEDLVGKKTTSKTSSLWLMIFVVQCSKLL